MNGALAPDAELSPASALSADGWNELWRDLMPKAPPRVAAKSPITTRPLRHRTLPGLHIVDVACKLPRSLEQRSFVHNAPLERLLAERIGVRALCISEAAGRGFTVRFLVELPSARR